MSRCCNNCDYYDSLDQETQTRHKEEFRLWMESIWVGVAKLQKKEWTQLDYYKYLLPVAKKIRLPHQDIKDMEKKIDKLEEENIPF